MKCLKCGKRVTSDPVLGIPPYCFDCQNNLKSFRTKVPEFAGEKIKEARQMYAPDIEQPHYKGHLNKGWVDLHGEKKALERGFTKEEIKNAQYVYSGSDSYYKKYT